MQVGDVKMSILADDHQGWLLCDGRSLLKTEHVDLSNVVGTRFGSVDATHFNLPDARGRVLGASNQTFFIGDKVGAASQTLSTSNMPSHSHVYQDAYFAENFNNTQTVFGTKSATDEDNGFFYRQSDGSSSTNPSDLSTSSVGGNAPLYPHYLLATRSSTGVCNSRPHTMSTTTFECGVCCTEGKETAKWKRVACPGCDYVVCSPCQKQYAKIECMNCRSLFATALATERLGAKFVQQTAKQTVLQELMTQQRRELDTIGPLVEWTKQSREIKKTRRFGIRVQVMADGEEEGGGVSTRLPPKPLRTPMLRVTCPCPVNDCRGSVVGRHCNVCKIEVCDACLIRCDADTHHVCDPNVLETMKELRDHTKPCPSCSALIHKTEGCDHMHCTNCNTHFSYRHLTILTSSSNYHYRERLIRRQQQDQEQQQQQQDQDICTVSSEHDRIPQSVMRETMEAANVTVHADLMDALYQTPKAVRYLRATEFQEIEISRKSRDKFDELQVKYALGELTDKQWESYVYRNYMRQQSYELLSGILHVYLANTDGFQSELYHALRNGVCTADFEANLTQRVQTLIDIVNQNIWDIHVDLDSTSTTVLRIRSVGQYDQGCCSKVSVKDSSSNVVDDDMEVVNDIMLPIQLYAHQHEHVAKLQAYLQKYHFAIDLSPLGTGKTYTAAKIYQDSSDFRHIVTISPLSVKTKWIQVNADYRLQCRANLTYGEIAGKRFCSPKCGFLIRNDFTVDMPQENGMMRRVDKYNFTTTEGFRQLVEEGVLLVLDEFQQIKNDCAQTEACETLILDIFESFQRGNGKSRVLLLSGSPIDKECQAVRLFKTLGIMRHPKIVSGHQFAGINEIVRYLHDAFRSRSKQKGNFFILQTSSRYIREAGNGMYHQYAWGAQRYAFELFVHVVKANATSAMDPLRSDDGVVLNKYNGYFHLNEEANLEKMRKAVEDLTELRELQTRMRTEAPVAGTGATIIRQMMRLLIVVETSKIDTFARLARTQLESHPCKKVVLGVNFLDTIADLSTLLAEYDPLIFDGSKTIKQRTDILAKFQSPSTEYRVLIGNTSVLSSGIDLDDKDGGYPRVCYVSPNFKTIDIYQLGHRFKRGLDTRSSTDIYMVYSDNRSERHVIEALSHKGEVMKRVTSEQSEAGVVFPCDYVEFVEE
jgi:microcystin-dependent protein